MKTSTIKRTTRGKSNGFTRPAGLRGEAQPDRDYTKDILDFLQEAHGRVRVDSHGEFFYEGVSTLSLHFLLKSNLPGKEILWRWYQHFEHGQAENIYQTLPPQRDGEFLDILDTCEFKWDRDVVRASGLLFLHEHRTEVYLGLEEALNMRLEEYETMDDQALADWLHPKDSWSDSHLRKLIRRIQTQPLDHQMRQRVYQQFESDYLRATARHLLDEAQQEQFWKSPPPELELLHSRLIIFSRTMANTARRLGVYISRREFGQGYHQGQTFGNGASNGRKNGSRMHGWKNRQDQTRDGRVKENIHNGMATDYFETLGLTDTATLEEVKSAYREQVKLHHPDQGGSVQDFLELQEAYEFLLTQVY